MKLPVVSTVIIALTVPMTSADGAAAPSQLTAAQAEAADTAPRADHHQHLLSPAAAALLNDPPPLPEPLPLEVDRLLRQRAEHWNDKAALSQLYTADSVVLSDLDPQWIRGAQSVADYLSARFARPFRLTPVAYTAQGSLAHVAGYFSRGEAPANHFGRFHLTLHRDSGGRWRIAAEDNVFPGPPREDTISAEQLVAMLDEAGIRRAAVLSEAYWFDRPDLRPKLPRDAVYAKVRAENDWTAQQVAQFPDRLLAFCSFNPLNDYAVSELERCAATGRFAGLKLHFNSSGVDLTNPQHVARLQGVFEAANRHRLPIIAHVRTGENYGREQVEVLLNRVLPAAPDISVQIAHLWGGENFSDSALAAFATAVAAGHPSTKNLYFDVAEAALVAGESQETLNTIAERIRQIGIRRVVFGSDAAFNGRLRPKEAWAQFRTRVPLDEAEIRAIAGNVAPYMR
jgi:predicted TIM-barrel fold metal-dependent hydrolase